MMKSSERDQKLCRPTNYLKLIRRRIRVVGDGMVAP